MDQIEAELASNEGGSEKGKATPEARKPRASRSFVGDWSIPQIPERLINRRLASPSPAGVAGFREEPEPDGGAARGGARGSWIRGPAAAGRVAYSRAWCLVWMAAPQDGGRRRRSGDLARRRPLPPANIRGLDGLGRVGCVATVVRLVAWERPAVSPSTLSRRRIQDLCAGYNTTTPRRFIYM